MKASRALDADRADLAAELRKRVSGDVRFDNISRVLYSTDASIYQMEPLGVVIPRTVEDVLAVVEVAGKHGVPILPRCAGTSLSGQTVNHAIVLDFTRHLDQALEINKEERWARVQPGLVLDHLNRKLAPARLQFAPDPTTADRACVGGAIGNNSCGSHSVVYGKTVDHVQELDVVLTDGSHARFGPLDPAALGAKLVGDSLESTIYRRVLDIRRRNREEVLARFPRILRRVSGYNLDDFIGMPSSHSETTNPAHRDGLELMTREASFNLARMVVGSEGTLCVVTEARVGLVPAPAKKALAVLHFRDMAEACDATWEILAHGPSAVEMIGRMIIDRCRESPSYRRLLSFIEGEPDTLLAVEFSGDSEVEVAGRVAALRSEMERKGLGYACVIVDEARHSMVWGLRRAGLGLLMSARGDAKPMPYVEDTAVDPRRLGSYVRRFEQIVRAHGTTAGYHGHASVGSLHIRPLVNLKTREGIDRMVSLANAVSDLVLEFGGSLSGEHGDGIVRGAFTEKMFGPKLYQAFREVKSAFDPQNIMNPGKIVDCPPISANLRFGERYRAINPSTKLDFSRDSGYGGAVEMCNGMGACRKDTGTMCPSFMAVREEEHSTRGRANLLRAALSGALPKETLASPRLFAALDLCLECKGCKAECEAGLDMAKLKYEFLDKYNQKNGAGVRSRLFANIDALSRIGSRLAPLSNWVAGNTASRLVLDRALGVHRKRRLPPFVRRSFPAWFDTHQRLARRSRSGPAAMGPVVLLNDTYMNYSYPETGIAAVELLERAGFNVILANGACCGRPMISKGFLDKAVRNARRNVDLLRGYAADGVPIVGCEPSCLLTLRDEYPELLRTDASKLVARQSFLIDEFLDRLREEGKLQLQFSGRRKQVLFHGHCHQKALAGSAHAMAVLRLPPGYQVEEIMAGCCGMAGAFGYEKEHYDLSLAIGRHSLFPAIEAKGADWEVAVMGVSCRQQVEDGTGRGARHLVEVLRDAL